METASPNSTMASAARLPTRCSRAFRSVHVRSGSCSITCVCASFSTTPSHDVGHDGGAGGGDGGGGLGGGGGEGDAGGGAGGGGDGGGEGGGEGEQNGTSQYSQTVFGSVV